MIMNKSVLPGKQSPIHSRPRLPSPDSINGNKHVNIIQIGGSTDELANASDNKKDPVYKQPVYSVLNHGINNKDCQYDKMNKITGGDSTMRSSGFFDEDDITSAYGGHNQTGNTNMETLLEVSDESGHNIKQASNMYVPSPSSLKVHTAKFTTTVIPPPRS